MSFLKSSLILVLVFLIVGPGVGGYTLLLLVAKVYPPVPDHSFIFLSYIAGVVPAFIAAVLDGVLLWSYKGSEEKISLSLAVLLGELSGIMTALLCGLFFGVWFGNKSALQLLGYITIFAVPGAVCGIFNKLAWRWHSP